MLNDDPIRAARITGSNLTGLRKAIEKAFRAIPGEHEVRIETGCLCMLQEAALHGSRKTLARGGHEAELLHQRRDFLVPTFMLGISASA